MGEIQQKRVLLVGGDSGDWLLSGPSVRIAGRYCALFSNVPETPEELQKAASEYDYSHVLFLETGNLADRGATEANEGWYRAARAGKCCHTKVILGTDSILPETEKLLEETCQHCAPPAETAKEALAETAKEPALFPLCLEHYSLAKGTLVRDPEFVACCAISGCNSAVWYCVTAAHLSAVRAAVAEREAGTPPSAVAPAEPEWVCRAAKCRSAGYPARSPTKNDQFVCEAHAKAAGAPITHGPRECGAVCEVRGCPGAGAASICTLCLVGVQAVEEAKAAETAVPPKTGPDATLLGRVRAAIASHRELRNACATPHEAFGLAWALATEAAPDCGCESYCEEYPAAKEAAETLRLDLERMLFGDD